jgi:hypothetical protein
MAFLAIEEQDASRISIGTDDLFETIKRFAFKLVYYTCIGAKDRIFDHCFPRNSVATTPATVKSVAESKIRPSSERPTVHSGSNRITRLVD